MHDSHASAQARIQQAACYIVQLLSSVQACMASALLHSTLAVCRQDVASGAVLPLQPSSVTAQAPAPLAHAMGLPSSSPGPSCPQMQPPFPHQHACVRGVAGDPRGPALPGTQLPPRSAVKRKRCGDVLLHGGPPAFAARAEGSEPSDQQQRPQPASPAKTARASSSLAAKLCSNPLQAYIAGGQLCDGLRKRMQASNAMKQTEGFAGQPSRWTQRRINTLLPGSQLSGMTRTHYDKAFSAEFVGPHEVAVSTKCGQVLRVNCRSGQVAEMPLPGSRWAEPPIYTEDDLHRYRVDRGGIHCVRANASQNLLATSGGRGDSHEVYVLDLTHDKWQAVRRGRGHTNWVFCLSWISDRCFVTGSRDKTVQLWSPFRESGYDMQPAAVYDDVHSAKVCCCLC